jgi:hypothetical protein
LWLFNWSRTSRSLGGFAWYATLPFTLLNVAAQTASARPGLTREQGDRNAPGHDPMIAAFVVVQGLLMSAAALIWTIAIVETALGHLRLPVMNVDAAGGATVVACTTILMVFAAVNAVDPSARGAARTAPVERSAGAGRITSNAPSIGVSLLNTAVVVGVALWLVLARPGQFSNWVRPVDDRLPGFLRDLLDVPFVRTVAPLPVTDSRSPCYLEDDLVGCYAAESIQDGGTVMFDVLSSSILVGFLASAVLALYIFVRAVVVRFGRRADRRVHAASLSVAAFLIMGAWALLVTFASATRLGLFWLLESIDPFIPLDLYTRHTPQPYFVVLPFEVNAHDISLINSFPLLGLVGALAFAACVLLSGMFVPKIHSEHAVPVAAGAQTMRYLHRTIRSLDRTLPWVVLISGVLWAGAIALFLRLYGAMHRSWKPGEAPPEISEFIAPLAITQLVGLVVTAIAVVAIGFIATSGGDGKLKQTFDVLADVAGFWPREWHPLAGASYRQETMRGLSAALDGENVRRILLVGHSQGSVISYWFATHVVRDPSRIDLVTCGSPIRSIYSTVFPRWFGEEQNRQTLGRIRSWSNVWRATDPIATPLEPQRVTDAPGITNVEAADPSDNLRNGKDRVRGHSNYWTDQAQTNLVDEVVVE